MQRQVAKAANNECLRVPRHFIRGARPYVRLPARHQIRDVDSRTQFVEVPNVSL